MLGNEQGFFWGGTYQKKTGMIDRDAKDHGS